MSETNGTYDSPLTGNQRQEFLRSLQAFISAGVSRAALAERLSTTHGGDRKLWDVLGYPSELTYEHFLSRVRRGDLAKRIVWAYPAATWTPPPEVWDEADQTGQSAFELAWVELARRLGIWGILERLDRLAQIGHYAILLITVRGQPNLEEPLQRLRSVDPGALVSLTPYSERFAEIDSLTIDPQSPNFGRAERYRLDFNRGVQTMGGAARGKTMVHYSRIIHIAEDVLEDEIYGLPRLEPVWNRLQDLDKVAGGSAEMFWLGALRGLVASLKEGYSFDPDTMSGLSDEIDEFVHKLRRWIRADGVDIKEISSAVASPKDHSDILLDAIAGGTGIPRRMLTGSERGELASTQDKENWNARVMERRAALPESGILRPLIDRLIEARILPEPAQAYVVDWPDLQALSETEKATNANTWANALSTYAGPGLAPTVVPEEEFRDRFLGIPAEIPPGAAERDIRESTRKDANPVRGSSRGFADRPLVRNAQDDAAYRILLGLADRLAGRMRGTFIRAVNAARTSIDQEALLMAIAGGDTAAVEALIPLDALAEALAEGWTPAMRTALTRAADLAAANLSRDVGEQIAFDFNASTRAAQWLEQHGAEMVSRVETDAKQLLRQTLEAGYEAGRPAADIGADLRQFLGLTRPQQEASERFRARLLEQGVAEGAVDRRVEQYVQAKIRERGLMIGRTEILTALGEGQQSVWDDAVSEGLLDAEEWVKEWLTAEDDVVDVAICEPMPFMPENENVPIDGQFTTPQGAKLSGAPAHPG